MGHTTLVSGAGPLKVGEGPVRTGVTVVLPRPHDQLEQPVFAAVHALNGVGELTGAHYIAETGAFIGPIAITGTHNVGVVWDAISAWLFERRGMTVSLPVVGETLDGSLGGWRGLNDANGGHLKRAHVYAALDSAATGRVEQGSVGGGTGMICNGFKGGIGTASRRIQILEDTYSVGVLLQCNYGIRPWLTIAGVPVGRELTTPAICFAGEPPEGAVVGRCEQAAEHPDDDLGSIIVVVATDVPLLPHQLERVARRVSLGLGRLGSASGEGSGDIFLAFTTAHSRGLDGALHSISMLDDRGLNLVFGATVQATEEAVIDAMLLSPTMVGADGLTVPGLPAGELVEVLQRYGRINSQTNPQSSER